MNYLDTSVLVAAISAETASDRVQSWMARQEPESLCITNWAQTEFSSALSMKVRLGILSEDRRAMKLRDFAKLCDEHLVVIPTAAIHFAVARKLADRHLLGLRAGDALHFGDRRGSRRVAGQPRQAPR
jgi:uncharacterized protein